jgi:hypothetical protein
MISKNTITGFICDNDRVGLSVSNNASPTVTGNSIMANATGVKIDGTSGGTFQGNTIKVNSVYGLNYSGTTIINANNCDWGDPSGPLDDSDDRSTGGLYNPTGKGNKVSDHVNYDPWVKSNQTVLSVSPANQSVTKDAGTTTFSVSNTGTGTMPWTAAVTTGGSWLSITSGASGSNAGTIACSFTANTDTSPRTGTIRVTASGATGSPKDVTVTQASSAKQVISGTVKTGAGTAISGVTITFSNGGGTAATDAAGNYSISVPDKYSGTATPAKTGYTFTPASKTYTNVTASQTGQNYVGTVLTSSKRQFWGVWSDGVYAWDKSTNKWTKMASTSNALMIDAGKVDADTVDDLIGVWSSGLYVRQSSNGQWLKLSATLPTWIAAGDLNNDGRDDVIGSWKGDGVYSRNSATGKWTKLSTPARQLATGNVHGDGRDDLIGVWDGIWARYSATSVWQKIDASIPIWMTAGDMTGSGRSDIVGSYATGTWCRNSVTGAWSKVTTPAEQLVAGDIDNDGRDDLIGIWSNAVWVRYGASGKWQQISSSKPKWITTGKVVAAVQSADSLEDPMESADNPDVVDLSQEGPGGAAFDMSFLDEDGPTPIDGEVQ